MEGTSSTQKGLTLVEAIIVILIIGIVTAIAIPHFQKFAANANLRTAARNLVADFSTLKQRAMSENMWRGTCMWRGTSYIPPVKRKN